MARFPRAFYLVTGLATMTFIASTLIQPFFSLYVAEKGPSPIELGLIISLMSYTTLVTRLPLGLATSRIGIWWVVPLALIGQSSSYILYSVVSDPTYFYPIRIFHAISLALLNPTLMSLASTISPEGRKGEAFGIYLTSVGLAMMGGPLLCSFFLSYFDYQTILRFSAIIPLIVFPVYLFITRDETLGPQLSKSSRRETVFKPSWRSLKKIMAVKPVQALTYGRFTFAVMMSIMGTLYPIYAVNSLNIDPAVYAFFFTLRGLANTLSRLPTGRLSDMIGRKKPLIASFTLLTAVLLLLSRVVNPVTIGFVMFLYGVAHGMRAVSEWSFLGDVVSSENLSISNFYFSSVFDLGSALGATFAGSATTVMSTPDILSVASIVVASSIFVIAFTKTPQKDS
jgi:MFS family permease